MNTVDTAIISAFEKRCKIAPGRISTETIISDLGIDSLMFMEIIMDIETKLDKSLEDDVIIKVLTVEKVGDLCNIFAI